LTEFWKTPTIFFREHPGDINLKPSDFRRRAGGWLDSGGWKTCVTAHLRRIVFVSSVRAASERMAYVYEFSTAVTTLERKGTTGIRFLYAEVRASSRDVQIMFTISRQLASSLREEVEKARKVWAGDIYPRERERVMAGHRDKTRGEPAPGASEPWYLTVLCVLPCYRSHGPGS